MTVIANATDTISEKDTINSLKATLKIGKTHGDAIHQAMLAKVAKFIEELKGLLIDTTAHASTAKEQQSIPVKQFEDGLPATFMAGGRTYRIHSFMREGDGTYVNGKAVRDRGIPMKAAMGVEDGEHIYKHREEIPVEYREKTRLAFPDWLSPCGGGTCVVWEGDQWVKAWSRFGYDAWCADYRIVSREDFST